MSSRKRPAPQWAFPVFAAPTPASVVSSAATANFKWVACGLDDGTFEVVDVYKSLNGEVLFPALSASTMPCMQGTFSAHRWKTDAPITATALDPDGVFAVIGTKEGQLQVWGLRMREEENVLNCLLQERGRVQGVGLVHGQAVCVCGLSKGRIVYVDLNTGKEAYSIPPYHAHQSLSALHVHKSAVLTANLDGRCLVYDPRGNGKVCRLLRQQLWFSLLSIPFSL